MTRVFVALWVVLGVVGCDTPTRPDPSATPCRQTHEFGNFGCARFVVLLPSSIQEPPTTLDWAAEWVLDGRTRHHPMPFAGDPRSRVLELTLWASPSAGPEDVVVVSRVWDAASAPLPAGQRLPLVASDSATYTVSFVPVGAIPVVDTIRLAPAAIDPSVKASSRSNAPFSDRVTQRLVDSPGPTSSP